MTQQNLIGILEELQRTLPRYDSLSTDNLNELADALEAVLGRGKIRIHEHQDGSTLPHDLQQLYDALDYFQTVRFLQGAIAADGLLSVPCNFTGLEIAHSICYRRRGCVRRDREARKRIRRSARGDLAMTTAKLGEAQRTG